MAHEALQNIIGLALTDPMFGARLLTDPLQTVTEIDLTEEEAAFLLSVHTATVPQLGRRVERWLAHRAAPGQARREVTARRG